MPEQDDIPRLLALLRTAPASIGAATRHASDEGLCTPPRPGEWSAVEILAHLRSCADVWGGCIARLLTDDAPVFRAVNPRSYIKQTDYPRLEFAESLATYTAQRWALLTVLEGLPDEAWERSGTVRGAGSPLTRTVYSYVERLARHERPHLSQIAGAVPRP